MTDAERKFLRVVAENNGSPASYLGSMAYSDGSRKPQAYARPAANVLYRLRKQGMVGCRKESWATSWWVTDKGWDFLQRETENAES